MAKQLTFKQLLERESFFDGAILKHGFVDYMRDYELITTDITGKYLHKYQFVGCVEAIYRTELSPEAFAQSISDKYVFSGPDYPNKAEPDGFIWGVRYSNAYPGLIYIENSHLAQKWVEKMKRPMHEVKIETEAFHLTLIFADIRHEFLGSEEAVGKEIFPYKNLPIRVKKEDLTSDGGVL